MSLTKTKPGDKSKYREFIIGDLSKNKAINYVSSLDLEEKAIGKKVVLRSGNESNYDKMTVRDSDVAGVIKTAKTEEKADGSRHLLGVVQLQGPNAVFLERLLDDSAHEKPAFKITPRSSGNYITGTDGTRKFIFDNFISFDIVCP